MKIANMLRISDVKAHFTKAAIAGLFAGAAFMAAPQKASAQVAFGIEIGHPGYVRRVPVYQQPYVETYAANTFYAPAPYAYAGYDADRRRDWDRHEFEEHRDFRRDDRDFRRDDRDFRHDDRDFRRDDRAFRRDDDHRDWDRDHRR